MPTYVYECKTCSTVFEADQSIKDDPLDTCSCGGPVKRVIQPVGIAFKGSGFYVNDSQKSSAPAPVADKPAETPTPAAEAPAPAATPAPAVTAPSAETK